MRIPFFESRTKKEREEAQAREKSLNQLIEEKENKIKELQTLVAEQQSRIDDQETSNKSLKAQIGELKSSLAQLREQISKDLTKPGQFQSKLTNFQKTILCYLFNGVENVSDLAQKLRVTADNLNQYLKPLEHLELIRIPETWTDSIYLTDNGFETALETPKDIKDAVTMVLETTANAEKKDTDSSEKQTLHTELQKKEQTISILEDRVKNLEFRNDYRATQRQPPPPVRIEQKQQQISGWAVCGIVCLIIFIIFVIAIAFSPEILRWLLDPSRWFGR